MLQLKCQALPPPQTAGKQDKPQKLSSDGPSYKTAADSCSYGRCPSDRLSSAPFRSASDKPDQYWNPDPLSKPVPVACPPESPMLSVQSLRNA